MNLIDVVLLGLGLSTAFIERLFVCLVSLSCFNVASHPLIPGKDRRVKTLSQISVPVL